MDKSKLNLFNYRVANTILGNRRTNNDWPTNWFYAEQLIKIFPDSVEIKDEASLAAFYSNKFTRAAEIINDILNLKPPRHMIGRVMGNKTFCAHHLLSKALFTKDDDHCTQDETTHLEYSPFIFVCHDTSATTVINFLNNCADAHLFSHLYYLYKDDDEMLKMNKDLPDKFEFVKYDGGILESLKDKCTPYIFNVVGDWTFFDKRNYLTIMRDIIDSAGNGGSYGQVLMNQNCSSSLGDWSQEGVECFTGLERRYYEGSVDFKPANPSLINRELLYEYDFENNYKNTHKTAFMDGIHVVSV